MSPIPNHFHFFHRKRIPPCPHPANMGRNTHWIAHQVIFLLQSWHFSSLSCHYRMTRFHAEFWNDFRRGSIILGARFRLPCRSQSPWTPAYLDFNDSHFAKQATSLQKYGKIVQKTAKNFAKVDFFLIEKYINLAYCSAALLYVHIKVDYALLFFLALPKFFPSGFIGKSVARLSGFRT